MFDKNNKKKQEGVGSYAQPQDLLYPGSSTSNYSFLSQQTLRSPTLSSSNGKQSWGRKEGTKKLAAPVFSTNNGVGDAPKSPHPISADSVRRSSKGLLNTLRGNSPAYFVGRGSEARNDARNGVHSYKPQESIASTQAPFYVVAPRSLSTPAPRRTKTIPEEIPPKVPAKTVANNAKIHGLDFAPLSAQTQNFALSTPSENQEKSIRTKVADEDLTPTQENISTFDGPSRANGQYLRVAEKQHKSKSAPTSPLFTTQLNTSPKSSPSFDQGSFPLKMPMRRLKVASINNGGEVGSEEASDFVESYDNFDQSPPPSQLLSARHTQVASRSQDLASELNDLAVAYGEGLLGEDEYRLLRQNVFDKMMGRGEMEVPREGRVQGSAVPSNGQHSRELEDETLSPAISTRSKRSSKSNLTSLFRRGSKNESHHQGNNVSSKSHSSSKSAYFSGNESIVSGTSQSVRSKKSASTVLESQISQVRRARTLRSGASHLGMEDSSSFDFGQLGGGTKTNKKGSSVYSASGISMGGVSMSSGNALLGGNYVEKSSDEINAEIAVVEAEGKRILESFKSLQMNAMGRYNLDYDTMKRAMMGVGVESQSDLDLLDDFVMIDGQEAGSMNGGYKHSNGNGDLLGGLIRKTRSFGNLDSLTNGKSRKGKTKSEARQPPSSYKGASGYQQSNSVSPPTSSPLESPDLVSQGSTKEEEEEEIEVAKLRLELTEILRRRNQVSKKYSDRLAFLKSNLRSAKIREGLR